MAHTPVPPRAGLTRLSSVLPPPPRYPSAGPYYPGGGLAGIVPLIETNNTISTPTGPEWQFLVGEGELARAAMIRRRASTS